MQTRICRQCKEEKPIESFPYTNIGQQKIWRRHTCDVCESQRKQEYYNRNIERIRVEQNNKRKSNKKIVSQEERDKNAERARHYRHHLKQLVYAAYGNKCVCCGETEEKFLSVDHVNNDGYVLRKGKRNWPGTQFYVEIIKRNFPADFQILCMNCNFGKARNGGICPHESRLRDYPEREYTQAGGSAPDPEKGHEIVRTT